MKMPVQAKADQITQSDRSEPFRFSGQESTYNFIDNNPAAAAQRRLNQTTNNSPRSQQHRTLADAMNNGPRMLAQKRQIPAGTPAQLAQQPVPAKQNNTGLPDQLKTGVESLSGMSMDHVKVHFNSAQPAQLNAHAYAQSSDIHIAPGQEQHLPHEAWHVVQQAQGRVRPTMQMKGEVPVNDDKSLEHEADIMGEKASAFKPPILQAMMHSNYTFTPIVQKVIAVKQFALPGTYEQANADGYTPHGKTDSYNNDVKNYDRLASGGFVAGWREKMMDVWEEKGWVQAFDEDYGGGRKVKEHKDGKWVDERGIQLDHATSVATMIGQISDVNEAQAINAAYSDGVMKNYYHIEDKRYKHVAWPTSKSLAKKKTETPGFDVVPTVHAARKYYHDMDNLVPLTGSDNAAKGDDDSDVQEYDPDELDNQKEWLELTEWLTNAVSEKDIDEAEGSINAMQETLDSYDGEWPV